jgi:hypothetical protein
MRDTAVERWGLNARAMAQPKETFTYDGHGKCEHRSVASHCRILLRRSRYRYLAPTIRADASNSEEKYMTFEVLTGFVYPRRWHNS